MYTVDELSKYGYFNEIFNEHGLSDVLDSLTGAISRPYIIGFIKWLIKKGTSFSVSMLDLDNFKFVNDTYGHKTGDGVLSFVSREMIDFLDGYGIFGRFGGDEFIFINFRDISYDDRKIFFMRMYKDGFILRRTVELPDSRPFITGTTGCAVFPDDAKDYDTLFSMIDKTLYRGKSKGRNCYIIYVESKHKDIQIKSLKKRSIFNTLVGVTRAFDSSPYLDEKLLAMFMTLQEALSITNLYFIGKDRVLKDIKGIIEPIVVPDIDLLVTDIIFSSNALEDDVKQKSPIFYGILKSYDLESIMISKLMMRGEIMGYLMCAEPRSLRIWQDDEYAVMFSAGRMISGFLAGTGQFI